ncbi:hypothetical protein [Brachyspira innocens]|uniref:hypothetical protein n=1 Tax=Brachyspira innocens TaxID=13264 RepID=UPI0026F04F7A|nr:hypothetical protein [Brachyspira innocens]
MNSKLKDELINILTELNISNGKYYLQDAFDIIVKLSYKILELLDNELKKYNWINLHCILLEYYSDSINYGTEKIKLNEKFDDEELTNIVNIYIYLIELNLIKRYNGKENIDINNDENIIKYLYSIANVLYFIQINISIINAIKDFQNTKTKEFIYLEIDTKAEVIIKFPTSKEYEYQYNEFKKDNINHNIEMEFDDEKELFEEKELRNILKEELGVDYFELNIILNISNIDKTIFDNKKINGYKYVYEITYDEFVFEILKRISLVPLEYIEKIIKFIILDCNNITNIKNKKEDYLSVDKLSSRKNRFDLKPLVNNENNRLIFSFESIKFAYSKWIRNITYFNFLYDFDLTKSKEILDKKKEKYQNDFSVKIANLLESNGYISFGVDIDFHKRFNNSNLSYLGDYDVIAINTITNVILLIEAKFIKLSRDINELLEQQKEYYGNKEYIDIDANDTRKAKYLLPSEIFQRRINYFLLHREEILDNLVKTFNSVSRSKMKKNIKNININTKLKYTIKSYMVFNRYFKPFFTDTDFKVVSFNELKYLLENNRI